jgi:hypothetical protein
MMLVVEPRLFKIRRWVVGQNPEFADGIDGWFGNEACVDTGKLMAPSIRIV